MSEPIVRVEGRSSPQVRCALCHGDLDGTRVECDGCHVACHADCRKQLGRCPTLGCSHGGTRQPSRDGPLLGSGGTLDVSELASGARTGLLLALGAAGLGAAIFLIALASHDAFSPASWTPRASHHDADGGGAVLGVMWGLSLILTFAGLLQAWRSGRALAQLRQLAERAPVEAILNVLDRGDDGFDLSLTVPRELGRTRQDVRMAWGLKAMWVLRGQETAVRVRALSTRGPFLIESPAGDLALVFPA